MLLDLVDVLGTPPGPPLTGSVWPLRCGYLAGTKITLPGAKLKLHRHRHRAKVFCVTMLKIYAGHFRGDVHFQCSVRDEWPHPIVAVKFPPTGDCTDGMNWNVMQRFLQFQLDVRTAA